MDEEMRMITMPMVPLRNVMPVPNAHIHFDIKQSRSIQTVKTAIKEKKNVFILTSKSSSMDSDFDPEDFYAVGVVVKVKHIIKLQNGIERVLIEGVERAEFVEIVKKEPFYEAKIKLYSASEKGSLDESENEAYARKIKEQLAVYESYHGELLHGVHFESIYKEMNAERLIDQLTAHLNLPADKRYAILEIASVRKRAELFIALLDNEIKVLKIRAEIAEQLKQLVDKNQREYVLREQMKIIRKELGEEKDADTEADEYLNRMEEMELPEVVSEKLKKEIKRFRMQPPISPEYSLLRNYIDTLLEYPWCVEGEDNKDLTAAINQLEKDHYGLKKVKERIIDALAVRMMNADVKMPILCLVGPPGTGKTSIAKSIATAMNKKYVRIALGGVRDEAEIRGHRKTYVGAMPGRIAEGIKNAKVNNPLMLLDEIDKTGADHRGDTASALLEVLDGEQNVAFMDHYYEVPIDLSKVLFICTANDRENIPRPLLDRMEVIEIAGYTANEKFHIAKDYLVDKVREKNGLKASQFKITDTAIMMAMENYTREAGVRNLERTLDTLSRKAARLIVTGEKKSLTVSKKNLKEYLGAEKYQPKEVKVKDQVGVVTGLAWTSVGGDTLDVEVAIIKGKEGLKLTGNLGDVMKESAMIAYSYIRSRKDIEYLEADFFENHSFHIHVPEGAVPKDGPSAGVTLSTAIYSAITNKKVRGAVAMTGEVTLRGNVLAIGGLKEKILAAKLVGKTEIVIPESNKRNIEELDEEILEGLTIHYAKTVDDVLAVALVS